MLGTVLTGLIRFYRRAISPWTPAACRFHPTCSAYALEAVERHGALRGSVLAARRLSRCHPWGGSGYDPVPPAGVEEVAGPLGHEPAGVGDDESVGTDGPADQARKKAMRNP